MLRRAVTRILLRIRALTGERDRDIAAELRAHIEQLEDEYRASGMSRNAARAAARRRFGNEVHIREKSRNLFVFRFVDEVVRDFRVAIRSLRRAPGFTVTAILTLAVGVGGTAAVFSIVDGTLLRPLPFDRTGRLVIVGVEEESRTRSLSVSTFEALRTRMNSLDSWGASSTMSAVAADGPLRTYPIERVTGEYFEIFGLRTIVGRAFGPQEELPNGTRPAVISRRTWQEEWNGSNDVVGQVLRFENGSDNPILLTIVGVLEPVFRNPVPGTPATSVWIPLSDTDLDEGMPSTLRTVARVSAWHDIASVRAELAAISPLVARSFPDLENPSTSLQATPLLDAVVNADARRRMLVFALAAGMVFVIGIVNLVHLQASRLSERERELAVRSALGASRTAMLRQVSVETLVVSVAGATTAYGLLKAFEGVFLNSAGGILPRSGDIAIDGRVLVFALAAAIIAGLVVGVMPALRVSRSDPRATLNAESPSATEGRFQVTFRSALLLTETTLAVMLLVGAGLLIQSFIGMIAVDVGIDPEGLTTAWVRLPTEYDDDSRDRLAARIVDSLRTDLNVESVAFANNIPMQGMMATSIETAPGQRQPAHVQVIGDDYGVVTRTPLVRGRWIDAADIAQQRKVVVVSESAAERYWPGADPLGSPLRNLADETWYTVVGIVGDVYTSYTQSGVATVYFPLGAPYFSSVLDRFTIAARLSGGSPRILEEHILAAEPRSGVTLESVDESLYRAAHQQRIQAGTMSLLGGLAIGLAALGIYGVVAYSITRRVREIALRVAIGARTSTVVWQMVRGSAGLAFVGIVVGLGRSHAAFPLYRELPLRDGTHVAVALPGGGRRRNGPCPGGFVDSGTARSAGRPGLDIASSVDPDGLLVSYRR